MVHKIPDYFAQHYVQPQTEHEIESFTSSYNSPRQKPGTQEIESSSWLTMLHGKSHRLAIASPRLSLLLYFLAWKIVLFSIALSSPGEGYDTSTTLLQYEPVDVAAIDARTRPSGRLSSLVPHLSSRLVRWDAIYFTRIAQRGYVFEQEWAFGWGFTSFLQILSAGSWPEMLERSIQLKDTSNRPKCFSGNRGHRWRSFGQRCPRSIRVATFPNHQNHLGKSRRSLRRIDSFHIGLPSHHDSCWHISGCSIRRRPFLHDELPWVLSIRDQH